MSAFLVAPLELASTQSKSVHAKSRSFSLMREIVQRDGVRALWKGSAWYVAATTVSRGIWLSSYDPIRTAIENRGYSTMSSRLMASWCAGALNGFVSNPIWTLKTYAQLPGYPGLWSPEYRRQLFRLPVLMSGVVPAMTYISLESVSQLLLLEAMRDAWSDREHPNALVEGAMGAIARMAALPFTYPLHVVTLRYREAQRPPLRGSTTFLSVWKTIHQQRAWYGGMAAYSMRAIPQAGWLFFFHAMLKNH